MTVPTARTLARLVVVAGTAWMAVLVLGGGLYYDDLANLEVARASGIGLGYLTRDLFGHVVPGFMALVGAVAHLGGSRFLPAAAETVVGFGAALALVGPAARRCGASDRAAAGATALVAAAAPWVSATLWWSAALNAVYGALGGLAYLVLHLRWVERPTAARLAAATAALVGALSVQEGSAVFVLVAVGVTAAWFPSPARPGWGAALRDRWAGWAAAAAAVGASALLTAARGSGTGPAPSWAALARFAPTMVLKGYLPGLVGMGSGPTRLDRGTPWVGVALLLGLLALAAWVGATGRAGLAAAAVVAVTVSARALLVGWSRLELLGWSAATEQRYLADLVWLAPVLGAAAWTRSAPGRRHRRHRAGLLRATPGLRPLAVTGVGLVAVAGLVGQVVVARASAPYEAGRYARRMTSSLAAERAVAPEASVLDTYVPATVLGPQFGPFLFLSRTLGPGLGLGPYNDASRPLVAAASDGRLAPVALVPVTRARLAAAFTADGQPEVRPVPGRSGCWRAGADRALVWLPLRRPLPRGDWVLDVGVRPGRPAPTRWVAAGRDPAQDLVWAPHPAGAGRQLITPLPFAASQLGLEVPAGTVRCVTDVRIERAVLG